MLALLWTLGNLPFWVSVSFSADLTFCSQSWNCVSFLSFVLLKWGQMVASNCRTWLCFWAMVLQVVWWCRYQNYLTEESSNQLLEMIKPVSYSSSPGSILYLPWHYVMAFCPRGLKEVSVFATIPSTPVKKCVWNW